MWFGEVIRVVRIKLAASACFNHGELLSAAMLPLRKGASKACVGRVVRYNVGNRFHPRPSSPSIEEEDDAHGKKFGYSNRVLHQRARLQIEKAGEDEASHCEFGKTQQDPVSLHPSASAHPHPADLVGVG